MNLLDCKNKVFMLLDEMKLGKSSRTEYSVKLNDYADIAQKKIAQAKPIIKTYKISQNNIVTDNLLQNPLTLFDIKVHTDNDIVYQATGARAYYFCVDDVADVYIEELVNNVWVVLETINNNPIESGFKAYKGTISASNVNNEIRLRFSGDYRYNYRNIALYKSNYSSVNRIPNFEGYTDYTMPSDFYKFRNIVKQGDFSNRWQTAVDFKWHGNKIRLNHYDVGEYLIEYEAYPTTINSSTLDTYEFEIDLDACQALPFYISALCVSKEDDKRPYDTFMEQFDSAMMNLAGGYVATVQIVNRGF